MAGYSRPYRWLVGRDALRKMMSRVLKWLWSSTKLAKRAVLAHRPRFLRLTKPLSLSRDTRLNSRSRQEFGAFLGEEGDLERVIVGGLILFICR